MKKDWAQDKIKITDDIELFYTRTGGDKPPIVLAHGITDTGLCFHQVASDLEGDYDLIMYDAYGHGKSSRIDPKKRYDLSEDMHDLIEGLKLDKPGVIGHSMGSATAAGFAAKYPDMLSALILEDPPWVDRTPEMEFNKDAMLEWKKNTIETQKKTVKELIKEKKKESPNWEESILEEWASSKLEFDPGVFDAFSSDFSGWRDLAKAIKVPTLIVTGDNELGAIVTPEIGVEAVEIMDSGEFGHISLAGHCVRYEQYQPYMTMIKLFLKRNLPA